ncbi:MAG: hypothetical protein HFE73_01330 [Firmicutes bacterium]|nr:hypothetical protein [Bacillota bacterium]
MKVKKIPYLKASGWEGSDPISPSIYGKNSMNREQETLDNSPEAIRARERTAKQSVLIPLSIILGVVTVFAAIVFFVK